MAEGRWQWADEWESAGVVLPIKAPRIGELGVVIPIGMPHGPQMGVVPVPGACGGKRELLEKNGSRPPRNGSCHSKNGSRPQKPAIQGPPT